MVRLLARYLADHNGPSCFGEITSVAEYRGDRSEERAIERARAEEDLRYSDFEQRCAAAEARATDPATSSPSDSPAGQPTPPLPGSPAGAIPPRGSIRDHDDEIALITWRFGK